MNDNERITRDIVNCNTASTRKNTKYPNLDILSAEEARKRGRAGGKKSGETRKARKTMRESLLAMLEMELSPEKLQEMGVDISTLDGNYTMQGALVSAMLREAVNGSEKAMQLVRDTIGEAPKQEIVQEVITKDDMELLRRNIVS